MLSPTKKIFLVHSEDIKDICLALPCLLPAQVSELSITGRDQTGYSVYDKWINESNDWPVRVADGRPQRPQMRTSMAVTTLLLCFLN
jgi:hypothetical protein